MTTPAVAVLGLGEAGSRLAADLVAAGARVHGYDPLVGSTPEGVVVGPDPASTVAGCDVVLGVTTAKAALEAATEALPSLAPGAIYADLNTARPALKRELATVVADAGGRFADVALLGPVPARGLGTPALASGEGAAAFAEALGPLGMPVDVVSMEAGDAAALKLLRSVFMKGLAASALESLAAAEVAGHAEWLEQTARGRDRPTAPRAPARGQPSACRPACRRDGGRARAHPRARCGASDRLGEHGAARRALRKSGAITSWPWQPAPAEEMRPSERARTLVRGAYDLHVHVDPDVIPRRIDDVALARRFAEVGLAGFALKSHYTSTAERAQIVSAVAPGVQAIGALSLNRAVGGMNALAVDIAAREGARIVWMPTVDSPAETAGRTEPKEGDRVPLWARLQHELRELGLGIEPVHVTDGEGRLLPETRDVLRTIARHDLILATGHLAREDTFAVVDGALEEGVRHLVVTHPEFPCQDFSIDDQRELAGRGCVLERCLSTPLSGKTTWEHVFDGVRAVGVERTLFSSDCGNPDYPAVEDGLALWADRLLGARLRRG